MWNKYPDVKPKFDEDTRLLFLVEGQWGGLHPEVGWYCFGRNDISVGYHGDKAVVAWCEIPSYQNINKNT